MSTLRLLLGALALTLVLAACGGDSDDAAPEDEVAAETDEGTDETPAETEGGEDTEVAESTLPDGVAAVVNGQEILRDDLDDELVEADVFARANAGLADIYLLGEDGEPTDDAVRQILQQRIEAVIVADELERRGGEVTDADREDIARLREGIEVTPWVDTFIERNVLTVALQRVVVTEAGFPPDAEAWFATGPAELADLACSRHILLESEDEARAARARVVEDGEDFAAVAAELSVGPSGPSGGSLGCGDPAGFVEPFAEAVRELPLNEVSEPVETEFGWHVIEVLERGDSLTFDDIATEATAAYDQQIAGVLNEAFTELGESSEVEVDPAYGTWDGGLVP